MFPLKYIETLEGILRNTNLKLKKLSQIEFNELDGNDKDKFLFKLHKIRATTYLDLSFWKGLTIKVLPFPTDLCYVPKKTRKIINFANKYYDFYSQFQKQNESIYKH